MKTLRNFALIFLGVTTPCFAEKHSGGKNDDPDSDAKDQIVVTGVTPGANGTGSIAITGGKTFTVTANAAIVIDGKPSKISDVHAGLGVLSQTAPDSSAPEIDLKTLAAAPTKTKKAKQ